MFNKFLTIATVSMIALNAMPATAGNYEDGKMKSEKAEKMNIVETAMGNENFSTLVTAVKQAELVEALAADGELTVFAPTNDAFAKVPEETLASLLMDENKADLQNLLKYHVVSGKIMASDIVMGTTTLITLSGEEIVILKTEDGVTVDGAEVIIADVKASNGVIHAIDAVAMP